MKENLSQVYLNFLPPSWKRRGISSTHARETRETGAHNATDVVFVRHAQRGIPSGSRYLTELGRVQARATGHLLKASGIDAGRYDVVSVFSSFSGDEDPRTGLPRAAETVRIVSKEIGVNAGRGNEPFRMRHLELGRFVHPPHYDHDALLESFLPFDYVSLPLEEKAAAEQSALTRVFESAMRAEAPEARAYQEEVAGALAFVLLLELAELHRKPSRTNSLTLMGGHSSFIEFLLKRNLLWKDAHGKMHTGFDDVDQIGGPLNYAEALRFRLKTDAEGRFDSIKIFFNDRKRPVREGRVPIETLLPLAWGYAVSHGLVELMHA